MMIASRFEVALLGGLLLAGLGAGCDSAVDDDESALTVVGGTPVVEPPPPEPVDPPVPPTTPVNPRPEPPTYEVWCRHYCETLETTVVYSCVASGEGGLEACRATFDQHAEGCYEIRCAPQYVTPSTCFAQCDSLARFYGAVCGGAAVPAEPLCPESPTDADARCRAGCPAQ